MKMLYFNIHIYIYIYIYIYICNHENNAICSPVYHYNGFVATHAVGHMMHGYTLLVPINQRVFNKLSKEHSISVHKSSMTHRMLKYHRIKMGVIYMQLWKQCALPVITLMALRQSVCCELLMTTYDIYYQVRFHCFVAG